MHEYFFLLLTGLVGFFGIFLMWDSIKKYLSKESKSQNLIDNLSISTNGKQVPFQFSFGLLIICYILFTSNFLVDNEPSLFNIVSEGNAQEVDTFKDPTYEGLKVISDIRIVDLRQIKPVPDDKKDEKYSPVNWTRITRLKKLSETSAYFGARLPPVSVQAYQ